MLSRLTLPNKMLCISLSIVFMGLSHFGLAQNIVDQPKIKIVTSIKPLSLLVNDFLGELADVDTLLPASADPHHYSLKVSDVELLNNADAIFWLGPKMEMFLSKLLDQNDKAFALLPVLNKLESGAAVDHEYNDGHSHTQSELDPHVWLAPDKLKQLVDIIHQALVKRHPDIAPKLNEKKEGLLSRLEIFEKKLNQSLSDLKVVPFVVNHPAYQHFVEHFGLTQIAIVNPTEENRLSAKKIIQLKKQAVNATCLVAESDAPQIQKIGKMLGLPVVVVDPLASDTHIQTTEQFFAAIETGFLQCLSKGQ